MPSTRDRVAQSLIWTLIESVGLSGVSFLALIVFSRYLTPAEFGIASIALGIVHLLIVIVERLFHDALVQREAITQRHIDTAHCASVLLGALLSGLCWALGPWLAQRIEQPAVGPVLQWMGLSLVAMGMGSVLIALQRRAMEFRPLALRSLVGRLLSALIAIAMAVWGAGVWSLVAQQVLMIALGIAALWIMASSRPRLRLHGSELRSLLKFGLPSATLQLVASANQRVFIVLVGSVSGTVAAGYFGIAFRAVDMLRDVVGGAVSQLALPMFSRAQGGEAGLRHTYLSAVRLTCCLMFPLFGGLACASQEMVSVLFGAKWAAAAPYVSLLALLTFHFFPRMFATALFTALGRPGTPMVSAVMQTMVVVPLMLWAGDGSIEWAAIVWAGRLLIVTPIDMFLLRQASGLGYIEQWRGAFVPAIASVLMAFGMLGVKIGLPADVATLPRLLLMVGTGALVYTGSVGLIDRQLIRDLVSFARAAVTRRGTGR